MQNFIKNPLVIHKNMLLLKIHLSSNSLHSLVRYPVKQHLETTRKEVMESLDDQQ